MKEKTRKWLKEKVIITLTRGEMFDLANAITNGTRSDYGFTKSRDRKVRKLFADSIIKNHKLWLKVVRTAQNL